MRCMLARFRERHGLGALRWSAPLAEAARRYASDMVRRGYFSHTTPAGADLSNRLSSYAGPAPSWWIGEVLAWGAGLRSRPSDVLSRWLHSPPHRRILLNPTARDVGIGMAFGAPVPTALPRRSVTFVMELGWRVPGG
jgi:uncharacterized protein YkwD